MVSKEDLNKIAMEYKTAYEKYIECKKKLNDETLEDEERDRTRRYLSLYLGILSGLSISLEILTGLTFPPGTEFMGAKLFRTPRYSNGTMETAEDAGF